VVLWSTIAAVVAFIIVSIVKTLVRGPGGKRQRRDVGRTGHDFLRSLVHSNSLLYLKTARKK
jgi:hypothetical protein